MIFRFIEKLEHSGNKMKLKYTIIKALERFFRITPIITDAVFFESFWGSYDDNPKFVSEKLHEVNPKIKIIWSVNSDVSDIPNYVQVVKYGTTKSAFYKSTCKVSIDNFVGSTHHYGKRCGKIVEKLLKNKKRINISIWHGGTSLKYVGANVRNDASEKGFYSTSDFLVAGSNYSKYCLEKSVYNRIPVCVLGTPRNDILFKRINPNILKDKMKLPDDKKICLFAPTHRDSDIDASLRIIECLDSKGILESLRNKFGGDWIFVIRAHKMVYEKLKNNAVLIHNKSVFSGNVCEDMAEYLRIADFFITDYSSSLFDFMVLHKPCLLYAPDRETYENTRGMYMNMDDLPYPVCYSQSDIIKTISNYNNDEQQHQIKEFLNKIKDGEDGMASDRIAHIIVNFVSKGKYMIPKYT